MSLRDLFGQAVADASRAFNKPTIEDETQEILQSVVAKLTAVQAQIAALSLFSANETVEDISSRDLLYLLVPFVLAQVKSRIMIEDIGDRMTSVRQCQTYLHEFFASLESYNVIPEDEKALFETENAASNVVNRRDAKIKQYKAEKAIRARIESIRKQRRQRPTSSIEESLNDFDLIAGLLPTPTPASQGTDENEDEDEDLLRETTILLLRLFYTQAKTHLESLKQELELLASAPPPSMEGSDDPRSKAQREQNEMWKLDAPTTSRSGPLLDSQGKPLRPFTILPAGSSDRARLQAQVFRPDHNLPTMTVDEYLEIERARGKFIEGGGPASLEAPTSSEQLTMDSEADGTIFGDQRSEEKRKKDENWALFTEANPRGAGNTMNRG